MTTVTLKKLIEAKLESLGDSKYWTESDDGYASALKWMLKHLD